MAINLNKQISTTENTASNVFALGMPAFIITPEGRAIPDSSGNFTYQYYLKDHLGNTRVTYTQKGEVLQDNNYYPFGMSTGEATNYFADACLENKYLYNGKELDDDLGVGWYDYGARCYDPQLGRFHTLDPLSENYSFQSPFVYGANNPIRFIDRMGMGPGDPPGNRNFWISNTIGPTVNAINNKVNTAIDFIKDVANDPVTQDVLTMAGGAFSIATLNPVGITLGVTTLGIGTGKAIAHSNPDTFDQEKVDKAANTVTGNVTKAVVKTTGGDAELAGDIADGVENLVKGGKGLLDIATKTTKTIEVVDDTTTTVQGVQAINEVVESSEPENIEDNK